MLPAEFETALLSLREAALPRQVAIEEVPSPTRLAPWTAALALRTHREDDADHPLASGRLVILYDPEEQIGWNGRFRLIGQMRAQIDADMAGDPLLGSYLWEVMHSCLEDAGAGYHDVNGTVTREISEAFGGLELRAGDLHVELRASWTPNTEYLSEHLASWADLLVRTSGIAPLDFDDLERDRA